MKTCFHCGDACESKPIIHKDKAFCCHGCKTVYEILDENNLNYYYTIESNPGSKPSEGTFGFLKNETIAKKLLEFNEQDTQVVSLLLPTIHCSSCIWILENLNKLHPGVKNAQVNFPKKKARIVFTPTEISLHDLVMLLCSIGYKPYISLDDTTKKKKTVDRSLIYKLGVAGFAFGNIMFLSFPEYFEVDEFWLERFKYVFRWLMFLFSIPVVFYSGWGYFVSASKGIRSKILNIDVPIALGIAVLFLRSTLEIALDWGTGFFDSLAGLVFFLLLGRFFQQKTYAYLSFERDYKSYFPIAVTRLNKNDTKPKEEQVQVHDLSPGDRILIRNGELVPVDAILLHGNALIDYSFVTGEAVPVSKKAGDQIFAGGKQEMGVIELEVVSSVAQSYLTQLWSNEIFSRGKQTVFQSLTDKISKRFTVSIISIAMIAALFWLWYDSSLVLNVFTAVLIVACPCAIALASPFTLGNLLRTFGKHKLYLKNAEVIEKMADLDTLVFDKTGTLSHTHKNIIGYDGMELSKEEKQLLTSTLRSSNHPLSRSLYRLLEKNGIATLDSFQEEVGKGVTGKMGGEQIRIGSYDYVTTPIQKNTAPKRKERKQTHSHNTVVHVSTQKGYKGHYTFYSEYRNRMGETLHQLGKEYDIVVLSGDNDGERPQLEQLLPEKTRYYFNQKPEDKMAFIKAMQGKGKHIMMVGDGLNDAGALAQSDVGIAISENINVFSPACNGILDASRFHDLPKFLSLSKKGIAVIKYAFLFSLLYNLVGLGFAVTGNLKPVIAAILMPLSSISIVVFTTVCAQILGRKLNRKNKLLDADKSHLF